MSPPRKGETCQRPRVNDQIAEKSLGNPDIHRGAWSSDSTNNWLSERRYLCFFFFVFFSGWIFSGIVSKKRGVTLIIYNLDNYDQPDVFFWRYFNLTVFVQNLMLFRYFNLEMSVFTRKICVFFQGWHSLPRSSDFIWFYHGELCMLFKSKGIKVDVVDTMF